MYMDANLMTLLTLLFAELFCESWAQVHSLVCEATQNNSFLHRKRAHELKTCTDEYKETRDLGSLTSVEHSGAII